MFLYIFLHLRLYIFLYIFLCSCTYILYIFLYIFLHLRPVHFPVHIPVHFLCSSTFPCTFPCTFSCAPALASSTFSCTFSCTFPVLLHLHLLHFLSFPVPILCSSTCILYIFLHLHPVHFPVYFPVPFLCSCTCVLYIFLYILNKNLGVACMCIYVWLGQAYTTDHAQVNPNAVQAAMQRATQWPRRFQMKSSDVNAYPATFCCAGSDAEGYVMAKENSDELLTSKCVSCYVLLCRQRCRGLRNGQGDFN